MEENVALDSSKQKKFDKSIKGIKKLIIKKNADSEVDNDEKVKSGRITKRKRKEKGLVYLSHIPHGFYENEMTQYFRQFGVVTNVRVIRSKRTGRSKGYAFVEFKDPAVGQIVAETMNNYLMGKRLIKAAYIPPEKQKRRAFRKKWNTVNNPGNNLKIKMKKNYNENKDEEGELKRAQKILSNINKTKEKLRELGINYDFFVPVDVPEALLEETQIKSETVDNENDKKLKKKIKRIEVSNSQVKVQKKDKKNPVIVTETQNKNKRQITEKDSQKQKKNSLKDKQISPIDEFIKVGEDSDHESDSSLDFDSDEYEKVLENDDDDESNISDDDSDMSEEDNSEIEADDQSDESEEPPRPMKKKSQVATLSSSKSSKKTAMEQPQTQQEKRKAPQKPPVATTAGNKKPKFEKQNNQRKKQFKKK